MCVNNCKDDSGFTFICRHMDGTEITFKMDSGLTWGELGQNFRHFVLASGYILKETDCLCDAQPEPFDTPVYIAEEQDEMINSAEELQEIFDEVVEEMKVKPKTNKSKKKKAKCGGKSKPKPRRVVLWDGAPT